MKRNLKSIREKAQRNNYPSYKTNAGLHHSDEANRIKNIKRDKTRIAKLEQEYSLQEQSQEYKDLYLKALNLFWRDPIYGASVAEVLVSMEDAFNCCDRLARKYINSL